MGFDLKRDELKHCVEMVTGRELTGTVALGTRALRASIYSYDGTFHLPDEGPIYLRTCDNQFVSLYENIVGATGHSYSAGPPQAVTYSSEVHSNRAVVGAQFWRPEDLVRRVSFRVRHTDWILRNRPYLAKMAKLGAAGSLLSATEGDTTVRVWYSGVYDMDFDTPKQHWPVIDLEFSEGVPIEDVVSRAFAVVELFSLSLWAPLQPSDIRVCRMTLAEMEVALETNSYPGDFAVELVWPERDASEARNRPSSSLVAAFEDDDLRTMERCLTAWIRRRSAWKSANSMMMQVLAKNGEVSADRLIAACRWLEEIPTARAPATFSTADLGEISAAAAAKADALGHPAMAPRITGALRVLRNETHASRFTRLVADVGRVFGPDRLGAEAVRYLALAQKLRGAAAHGHFAQQTEQEFRELYNSILATEALCMLLTTADLPLDKRAYHRANSHQSLEEFFLAYK